MATEKQKAEARKNIKKAQAASAKKRPTKKAPAKHVRNAIARFDQVEEVSDAERARAWKRIKAAATKFDVEIEAKDWRELMSGGTSGRR